MWERWYDLCPQCGQVVFLIHPYVMPAFHEVTDGQESDLSKWGPRSLNKPRMPVQFHPCRFFEEHKAADWETVQLIINGEK
jgi:hypothetical protein